MTSVTRDRKDSTRINQLRNQIRHHTQGIIIQYSVFNCNILLHKVEILLPFDEVSFFPHLLCNYIRKWVLIFRFTISLLCIYFFDLLYSFFILLFSFLLCNNILSYFLFYLIIPFVWCLLWFCCSLTHVESMRPERLVSYAYLYTTAKTFIQRPLVVFNWFICYKLTWSRNCWQFLLGLLTLV